jgi:hypothetical protein
MHLWFGMKGLPLSCALRSSRIGVRLAPPAARAVATRAPPRQSRALPPTAAGEEGASFLSRHAALTLARPAPAKMSRSDTRAGAADVAQRCTRRCTRQSARLAGDGPDGGACAATPRALAVKPAALIKRHVLRCFNKRWWEGEITSVHRSKAEQFGWLWRVYYPDDDWEELNADEVLAALLPDARKTGADAGAGASASRARNNAHPHATTAAAPPKSPPPAQRFYGVSLSHRKRWKAYLYVRGTGSVHVGMFADEEAAAHAVDAALLARGLPAVNFPAVAQAQQQPPAGTQDVSERQVATCAAVAAGAAAPPAAAAMQQQPDGAAKRAREKSEAPEEEAPPAQRRQKVAGAQQRRTEAVPHAAAAPAAPADAAPAAPEASSPPAAALTEPPAAPVLPPAAPPAAAPPAAAAPSNQPDAAVATPVQATPPSDAAAAAAAAAPPPPLPPAAPAPDAEAEAAALADWLRAIKPPLTQLEAAVAAVPGSGLRLAVLDRCAFANLRLKTRKDLIDDAADLLGISGECDQLLFRTAALERQRRAPGGN